MPEAAFQLIAGHPALDFANTLDNRDSPEGALELLTSYEDLLRFCKQLGGKASGRLSVPDKTEALETARTLREAIFRIFASTSEARQPEAADVAELNSFLRGALPHREIAWRDGVCAWHWKQMNAVATGCLWPIVFAAAELLVSPDCKLVRRCQSSTCGWLFLDQSKNHSRRWCDMKVCGNRTKARRYYERHA